MIAGFHFWGIALLAGLVAAIAVWLFSAPSRLDETRREKPKTMEMRNQPWAGDRNDRGIR